MIRVYGNSVGHGSFCRVAEGIRLGLSELGKLSGFVPLDAYDEEAVYEGADADVAVFVGPPPLASRMTSIGWHKERWLLLPANSTWMPKTLIKAIEEHVTGFLAPSEWAAGIMRKYTEVPVSVFRHGVHPDFIPNAQESEALKDDFAKGYFRMCHLASTTKQRKGTRELLIAWIRAVKANLLGTNPLLHLIVDGQPGVFLHEMQREAMGHPRLLETVVFSRQRWNMDAASAAHYYRKHHAVCQPSRGEGFGLVPLEALSCGVPVVMTDCTGHSEYANLVRRGIVSVLTGPDAAIDDGPEAKAPSLDVEHLLVAIGMMHEGWSSLHDGAMWMADHLRAGWSWRMVTERWLRMKEDA